MHQARLSLHSRQPQKHSRSSAQARYDSAPLGSAHAVQPLSVGLVFLISFIPSCFSFNEIQIEVQPVGCRVNISNTGWQYNLAVTQKTVLNCALIILNCFLSFILAVICSLLRGRSDLRVSNLTLGVHSSAASTNHQRVSLLPRLQEDGLSVLSSQGKTL